MNRRMRLLPLLALLALAAASPERAPVTARPLALNPEDPAQTQVGRLRYLGGVEISSPDRRVGGVSGMRFLPDGRLLAITDAGDWLTLTLAEPAGRLTGVGSIEIDRMRAINGQPMRGKSSADAEALELGTDGTRYVAFERDHRIMRFAPTRDGSRPVAFPDRDWLARLPSNAGVEAMARVGDSWLYLAEEAGPNAHNGVLARARGGSAYGRLVYRPPAGFKPTDAVALDANRALVLNRRYSPMIGVAASLMLVEIDHARLALGSTTVLAEFTTPLSIDNMEALAIRRAGDRIFVYLASDDNFSPLQRTLIMKFELLAR